jgi:predicted phage-related endonuclease
VSARTPDAMLTTILDADYDRCRFIGGSNAAAIMDLGAYGNTPLTTYLAKIGEGEEEIDERQRLFLVRRKRWEPVIVEMLKEEFDAEIVSMNQRYVDASLGFLAAEIDFEWRDGDGFLQNGEIKTVSPFAYGERFGWGEPGTSDIPVHYACQNMHGLGVTRRRVCINAVMVGLDTMTFYPVYRDDATIETMREHMVWFWHHNVLQRVPPEPMNLDDSMKLALRLRGRPVEINEGIADRLEQLREIRASRKHLEDDETAIKFEVLEFIRKAWMFQPLEDDETAALLKDNAVLMRNGQKVATFNLQSTRRIDVDRLRTEQPMIAAEFTKTTDSRVLRISKSL